jgi:hypothetical protein
MATLLRIDVSKETFHACVLSTIHATKRVFALCLMGAVRRARSGVPAQLGRVNNTSRGRSAADACSGSRSVGTHRKALEELWEIYC